MCIDYRILNGVSRKDNSPLPNINDLLDEAGLNKSKWFSAIDLMMGYHQVGMTERAQRYSAFVSHLGQFTYLRMPFGLCNAPATFSNLMRKVQATLQRNRILVYMDDILVTTPTVAEHARQLAKLCDRLVEVGLTIKPEKSIFLKQEVLYLGFVVSASGVKADPTKLKAMREYARPVTPKDICSFLGLCSYYRRFVKGFAQIAAPLHAALQGKPEKLIWTLEMEEAFKALKRSLTTPPVLAYPQMGKPYFLFTDASRTGLGCVLKQKDDKGRLHPIAYGSRSLSKEEKNYGVTDLEASAVIFGIEHFDVYIRSQDCTIVVDHKALKNILLSKGNLANDRQIRWRNRFMGTNFKIKYTKGANQVVADTLSRYPCPGSEPTEDHPTDCDPYDDLTEIAADCGESTEPIGSNIPHNVPLETEKFDSIESTLLCDHAQMDTLAGDDLGAKRLALALDPISPVKYDAKQVRAAQKKDRFFQKLFDYLENEKLYGPVESRNYLREFARDCEILDGVLYYGRSGNPEELRVAVPTDMRWELLKEAHFYTLGGHFAAEKTYFKLKNRYWWPHMKKDVLMFCRNCLVCRRRHGEKATWIPPLSHLPIPQKPNDLIGMDLLKMPLTEQGNQYILVATDCLSRKATTVALRTKEASEVAQAIALALFAAAGPPKMMLTDKGSEFTAEIYKQLCFLCGVKSIYTTTFHPQGNALAERFNRALVDGLSKLRTSHHINWDMHLPIFTMAYNDTVHRAHGCTPHEVQFGSPMNSVSGSPLCGAQNPYKYNEGVNDLIRSAQEIWKTAQDSIKKYHEDSERYFNQRVKRECPFKLGDLVWYRKTPVQKMASPWTGPWKILELDLPTAKIGRRDPKTNRYMVENVHVSNLSQSRREDDDQQWGTATSNKAYNQPIAPPKYPDSFAKTAKTSGVGEVVVTPPNAVDPTLLSIENSRGQHFSTDVVIKRTQIQEMVVNQLSTYYMDRQDEPPMHRTEIENLENCLVKSADPDMYLTNWLKYRRAYTDQYGRPPIFHRTFKPLPDTVKKSDLNSDVFNLVHSGNSDGDTRVAHAPNWARSSQMGSERSEFGYTVLEFAGNGLQSVKLCRTDPKITGIVTNLGSKLNHCGSELTTDEFASREQTTNNGTSLSVQSASRPVSEGEVVSGPAFDVQVEILDAVYEDLADLTRAMGNRVWVGPAINPMIGLNSGQRRSTDDATYWLE